MITAKSLLTVDFWKRERALRPPYFLEFRTDAGHLTNMFPVSIGISQFVLGLLIPRTWRGGNDLLTANERIA
jgi:hypothetical protein